MLCLNDNTPYSVKADELCAYDALRAIANRPVKDIVDSHGNNLLIYPHSFRQSKDKIGSQSILSWQTIWRDGKCDGSDISTGNVVGFIGIDGCDITIKSRRLFPSLYAAKSTMYQHIQSQPQFKAGNSV